MTPELGYGARERTGIPANSTVFDYEILAVKPLSFAKLMREALAAGTVDEAIAKVNATPNLKTYYVSASSIQAAANAANRKEAGSNEKVPFARAKGAALTCRSAPSAPRPRP